MTGQFCTERQEAVLLLSNPVTQGEALACPGERPQLLRSRGARKCQPLAISSFSSPHPVQSPGLVSWALGSLRGPLCSRPSGLSDHPLRAANAMPCHSGALRLHAASSRFLPQSFALVNFPSSLFAYDTYSR